MNKNLYTFCLAVALLSACTNSPKKETPMKEAQEKSLYPITKLPIKVIKEAESLLGEGPIWDSTGNRLFWVDIEGELLHMLDATTGNEHSWDMDTRVSTVVPAGDSKVLVALQNGIFCFDLDTEEKSLLSHPEDSLSNMRYNDGKCSPEGHFWVGSMELDQAVEAAGLYSISPDGTSKKALDDITISNGIAWTEDAKTMYYIDTYTQKIVAYDYNSKTQEISNPKTAIEVPKELGSPDGMAIDTEGMLWVGMWGGSAVTRWNPQTGKLIERIAIPALNVTSCAFGGEDMQTLYITTARTGMSENEVEKYPLSGSLFSIHTEVKGQGMATFAGCK